MHILVLEWTWQRSATTIFKNWMGTKDIKRMDKGNIIPFQWDIDKIAKSAKGECRGILAISSVRETSRM